MEFVGFTLPDVFIAGYGIDYAEKYRCCRSSARSIEHPSRHFTFGARHLISRVPIYVRLGVPLREQVWTERPL